MTFVEGTRRISQRERRKKGEVGENGVKEVQLKEGELDLGKMGMNDVLEEVGRRCRILGRREMISAC